MKRLLYIALSALLMTACTEDEGEVFYTAHYPIVRLDAAITLSAADAAFEEQIRTAVLADAPVKEGGSYQLDFNRFDGGLLFVRPTADESPIAGTFDKQPAAKEMTFSFGEQSYLVRSSSYTDETALLPMTLLTVDVTEQYRTLFESESILEVLRLEYTSYPY